MPPGLPGWRLSEDPNFQKAVCNNFLSGSRPGVPCAVTVSLCLVLRLAVHMSPQLGCERFYRQKFTSQSACHSAWHLQTTREMFAELN